MRTWHDKNIQLKNSCFELFGNRNTVFFRLKSWWKDDINWLLESSCFELFGGGKYCLFFSQKVDGKMIFTDYWKVLVLNVLEMRNTVFFWVKKWIERWYLLINEKFLFWTFRTWEIRSFLSQKVDGKMIFTWSSWAFHDIPRLGKYGFLCNVFLRHIHSLWIFHSHKFHE